MSFRTEESAHNFILVANCWISRFPIALGTDGPHKMMKPHVDSAKHQSASPENS